MISAYDDPYSTDVTGYSSDSLSSGGYEHDINMREGHQNYLPSPFGLSTTVPTSTPYSNLRSSNPQPLTTQDPICHQVNLLDLLESWKERTRDLWFRQNGIYASPTDNGWDELIPELRGAGYVRKRFGDIIAGKSLNEPLSDAHRLIAVDGLPPISSQGASLSLYAARDNNGLIEVAPRGDRSQYLASRGSPHNTEDSGYFSSVSTEHPTPRQEKKKQPLAISILGKVEPAAQVLAVTTSKARDPQTLTLLRNKSPPSDWGGAYRGIIRVQRPAGVKWNDPIRCAYVSPITGDQCRTRVKRGPDLERHLRTVHLRQEAQAVADALIPRSFAKLLPSEWKVGDRLDFDCPHCSIRFTRDDARNRHVKMKH